MRDVNGIMVRDTLEELLDPAVTAVICVDIQNDFCHPEGAYARHGKDMSLVRERLPGMVAFVQGAQRAGVPVAFIQQLTLPGNLSDSPAWLRFKTRDGKAPSYTTKGTWGAEFVEGLEPGPRDWVVEKFRPDAFHKTCLDLVLRAKGIETVLVLGVITEGCVESTVRAASYHDYYTLVLADGVASPNLLQHQGSMNLYQVRYPLVDSAQVLSIWGQGR